MLVHGIAAISDQIHHHLLNLNFINIDYQFGGIILNVKCNVASVYIGFDQIKCLINNFIDMQFFFFSFFLFDETPNSVDDLPGPIGLIRHNFEGLANVIRVGVILLNALNAALGVIRDGRQGLIDFMCKSGSYLSQ